MIVKELEKYECHECGVYYWVIDRDGFECPNCQDNEHLKKLDPFWIDKLEQHFGVDESGNLLDYEQ
jgi:Zn finger protein HypA/HybF involved in hydrogenase expression